MESEDMSDMQRLNRKNIREGSSAIFNIPFIEQKNLLV
jgi:hypothetical protein